MIYDFRLPDEHKPDSLVSISDPVTGEDPPVFYYDSESHLLGRYLTDRGEILVRADDQGTLRGVELWEFREMTVGQKPIRAGGFLATRVIAPLALQLGTPAGTVPNLDVPNVDARQDAVAAIGRNLDQLQAAMGLAGIPEDQQQPALDRLRWEALDRLPESTVPPCAALASQAALSQEAAAYLDRLVDTGDFNAFVAEANPAAESTAT